ncbi:MAG: endonuclease/exonuclease/phosphatase family protein [Gemmatimonadota bacterium]
MRVDPPLAGACGLPPSMTGARVIRWRAAASLVAGLSLPGCGGPAPPSPPDRSVVTERGQGTTAEVVLDGSLDEWSGVPILVEDEGDPDGDPVIDLKALSAADDPAWLFLQLDVGRPLNLQSMPGTVTLMVDSDGDPATGRSMEGMEGVEFAVDFSPRRDPANQTYGAGFALRLPDGATRTPYDVGLAGFPTHAAERFEVRLSRRPRGSLPALGPTVRLGMVARAADADAPGGSEEVDRLRATRYRLTTEPGPDPFQPQLDLLSPPAAGTFRIATWNVGSETFRNAGPFARVLGLVRPDVILLDEVYEDISPAELRAFFEHEPLASLGRWSFIVSRGGGRQKTVVAARDRTVRQEPAMAEVAYAPGAVDALRRKSPASFHGVLDYEARVNLSATGAWVEVDPWNSPGREVLFVPVDLQSAGWDGSPQDLLRRLQAQTLLREVRRVTAAPSQAPVVVAGDLNLVGGRGPLDLLLADGGNPFGPLAVATLPRLDEGVWATWLSERQALFGPGRLDFTLYSDETLEQVGGFVLGATGLSDSEMASLGIDGTAAAELKEDHLPMVVDLRLRDP